MDKKPKVAIYMSCYNHEAFVAQAMDSIINQTYTNWELFVANDASTDRTGEIIASYQDPRIHYFDFKENTKMVGAVNHMLDIIQGEAFDYIQVMSSDDWIALDKIERQVGFLTEHSAYKACFTWDKVVFDETAMEDYPTEYSHQKNRSRYAWMDYFLEYGNCINAISALTDKEVFFELGGMNENYIQLGDYRLWFRLAAKYPFYIFKEELTNYRRHGANLSNQSLEAFMRCGNERYRIIREIILPMQGQEFVRAFYKYLPYKECGTQEELWASKFILLKNMDFAWMAQVAMDIYFEHCDNKKFIDILEKKYYFFHRDFIAYTGNAGMGYCINQIKECQLPQNEIKSCMPREILLTGIDRGQLDMNTIGDYTYSTLKGLYDFVSNDADSLEQFKGIKESFEKIRKKRWERADRTKVLIIAAADSRWDLREVVARGGMEKDEYFVSYVNTNEDYAMGRKSGSTRSRELPNDVQFIELYNEEKLCLDFADGLLDNLRMIYYVDCLGADYECQDMVFGYSLDITQSCVMQEETYGQLDADGVAAVMMMQDVLSYES